MYTIDNNVDYQTSRWGKYPNGKFKIFSGLTLVTWSNVSLVDHTSVIRLLKNCLLQVRKLWKLCCCCYSLLCYPMYGITDVSGLLCSSVMVYVFSQKSLPWLPSQTIFFPGPALSHLSHRSYVLYLTCVGILLTAGHLYLTFDVVVVFSWEVEMSHQYKSPCIHGIT